MSGRAWRRDAAIALVLLLVGAAAGTGYVQLVIRSGGKPWFYQGDFGPAVMLACGHGFSTPDAARIPALAEFLATRTDRFSCTQLPADPPKLALSGPQPQFTWGYLMRAAALVWALRGVSWSGLAPLSGAMFGATLALTFLLFRLIAGVALSSAAALFVLTSPAFLVQLPNLRDYSKVPFLLAIAIVLGCLLRRSVRPSRLLALSAAYGAAVGVGIGFRNDPLITVPPFAVLLALARSTGGWRAQAGWKMAAAAVAALSFVFTSRPVLWAYGQGGGANSQHAALLGLMSPFDDALRVENGSLYDVGYLVGDSYAAAIVGGYASRIAGRPQPIEAYSTRYDAALNGYLARIATTLPADLVIRGYASLLNVVWLPSGAGETRPLPYASSRWAARASAARSALLRAVRLLWPAALLAAFAITAASDLRLATVIGALFVYFAAYPAIQFNERHLFHLGLIPLAAAAFVIQSGLDRRFLRDVPAGWPGRLALFAAAGAILIAAPVIALRQYQQRRADTLLRSHIAAAVENVPVVESILGNGDVALDVSSAAEGGARSVPGSVESDYLVAEFGGAACDARTVEMTLRYAASDPFVDFSRTVAVAPPIDAGTMSRVMITVFYYYQPVDATTPHRIWYRFKGIELGGEDRACLTGLRRMAHPIAAPLLLNAQLPSDWDRAPLYQTLTDWERRPPRLTVPSVHTAPPGLRFSRALLDRPLEPLNPADVEERAATVTIASGRVSVDGAGGVGGAGPFMYLARTKPMALRASARFVAEGTLEQGGLTIGLVQEGQWVRQAHIVTPGRFIAVVEVPADGDYSLVIANNLSGGSLINRFVIDRAGWVR